MSKFVDGHVNTFKRQLLQDILSKCTDSQKTMFDRIYPHGAPDDKLDYAIDLCDRTIKNNQKTG